MASKGGVHVLMVTLAMQGHMNPMLSLAKLLILKGLHVTLATTEVAREALLKCNTFATTKIDLEFFSDGFSNDFDRNKNVDLYADSLPTFGTCNLSNLIKKLSDIQEFSCIIMNPFVPWVIDVALQHEIPCAMLWIQPCALYAIYYRFFNELNPFPTMENPNFTIDLPGLPSLEIEDLPSFILPSNTLTSVTKSVSNVFQSLKKVKWVFGNSFYELEKDIVESMSQLHPIIPIGPLVPSIVLDKEEIIDGGIDMWKAEDTCLEWLDEMLPSSVVYVSFGSIIVLSAKQMENIALGLINSKKPFLWVVKPLEKASDDKSGELPSWFMEDTGGIGLVVPWCPQAKVLAHPAISCFMSHCGWNSTLEAIASGVPMIAFPQWTDQPTNAKMLVDVFKMGMRVRAGVDGIVSKEEVERCILEISVGPEAEVLKKKAVDWKEAARKAVVDGGTSDQNIQLFIDDIKLGLYEYDSCNLKYF